LTFAECHKGPVEVTWQLLIEEVCKSAKLDMSKLRGQGYSGAAYMGQVSVLVLYFVNIQRP